MKVVKDAIALGTSGGKDKLFKEVNMASGKFHVNSESSIYVAIYDLNGVVMAKEKGSGWVSYKHEDPATKKLAPKNTYVELWGDLVVTCGVHGN